MKSDRLEVFNRLQDMQNQLWRATEQLKDTRASGSQLENLAAISNELDKAQEMAAHILMSKFWD